jgi:hypothetical protein
MCQFSRFCLMCDRFRECFDMLFCFGACNSLALDYVCRHWIRWPCRRPVVSLSPNIRHVQSVYVMFPSWLVLCHWQMIGDQCDRWLNASSFDHVHVISFCISGCWPSCLPQSVSHPYWWRLSFRLHLHTSHLQHPVVPMKSSCFMFQVCEVHHSSIE